MAKKSANTDDFIKVNVQKTHARLLKIPVQKGPSKSVGKFSVFIEVSALKETLYIPVSIASGRKSTGIIYLIEGTDEAVSKATVDCRGEGTTIVTSGSLSYCKIPPGKTTVFKILADVHGSRPKKYRFVVSRINYKFNPNDLRYKRFLVEIGTESLKFN